MLFELMGHHNGDGGAANEKTLGRKVFRVTAMIAIEATRKSNVAARTLSMERFGRDVLAILDDLKISMKKPLDGGL